MENRSDITEIKPKNMYVPICITQGVCIAVILIAVIIIKMFFASSYEKTVKWCKTSILQETEITASFDGE